MDTPICASTAHVWLVSTETVPSQVAEAWLSVLDAEEHDRHARLVFKQDRDAYLGAHALLRGALAFHTGVEPAAWRFVRSRGEKPIATSDLPQLSFSLTHTRGLAACAVAREVDVGVDAEMLTRGWDAAVVQRTLSLAERRAVSVAAPDERVREFLTRWTLKEAYLKTLGIGLDRLDLERDLQRIAFHVDGLGVKADLDGVDARDLRCWRFATWATATHVVSAGARGRTSAPKRIVAASVDGAQLPGPGAFAAGGLGSLGQRGA